MSSAIGRAIVSPVRRSVSTWSVIASTMRVEPSFAAAAALCEAAGRVVLPYPVAGALLRRDGAPFAVVPDDRARVDHGDLFERFFIATE